MAPAGETPIKSSHHALPVPGMNKNKNDNEKREDEDKDKDNAAVDTTVDAPADMAVVPVISDAMREFHTVTTYVDGNEVYTPGPPLPESAYAATFAHYPPFPKTPRLADMRPGLRRWKYTLKRLKTQADDLGNWATTVGEGSALGQAFLMRANKRVSFIPIMDAMDGVFADQDEESGEDVDEHVEMVWDGLFCLNWFEKVYLPQWLERKGTSGSSNAASSHSDKQPRSLSSK